jgi:FKBP-type peptidyl-prolyl cis-trans isomerase
VDSSAEKAPPGTSTQSIYYILGQRNGPPGTFPPGWDYTLRGMVVGEKRRITLPYTLAFERKGVKDRGIPPFATMIYTVKLLSLT